MRGFQKGITLDCRTSGSVWKVMWWWWWWWVVVNSVSNKQSPSPFDFRLLDFTLDFYFRLWTWTFAWQFLPPGSHCRLFSDIQLTCWPWHLICCLFSPNVHLEFRIGVATKKDHFIIPSSNFSPTFISIISNSPFQVSWLKQRTKILWTCKLYLNETGEKSTEISLILSTFLSLFLWITHLKC